MSDTKVSPTKRGRGRPPSNQVAAAKKPKLEKPKVAGKRGRPPMPKKDTSDEESDDDNKDADGNAIVKRGPGRPPKNGVAAVERKPKKPKEKRGPGRPLKAKGRGRPIAKK